MSMAQLVEQVTGQVYPLGYEPVTIGRHEDNAVVLPDPLASRHHAEIAMQGGRWVVRDLGSVNGTYVNGQRIAAPQMLNHSDLIQVGHTRFEVWLLEAMAKQDTLTMARQDTLVERLRPEDVLKCDADEDGVGGDDPYDALRYGIQMAPSMTGAGIQTARIPSLSEEFRG